MPFSAGGWLSLQSRDTEHYNMVNAAALEWRTLKWNTCHQEFLLLNSQASSLLFWPSVPISYQESLWMWIRRCLCNGFLPPSRLTFIHSTSPVPCRMAFIGIGCPGIIPSTRSRSPFYVDSIREFQQTRTSNVVQRQTKKKEKKKPLRSIVLVVAHKLWPELSYNQVLLTDFYYFFFHLKLLTTTRR